ncbi:hypothetical protein [[Mycoplasma] gypis]|uniref:Uncharacterized protein n=1 Tax=[Mycoplasma] gypis TaxID=92404 RepID=A0ABZ2RPM0_9BACT|nr:hypothetical protein [[Mycoplasma] gypis]MBN0919131.1 hypothetical protein [[Mycoplasma] gypis]
MNSKKIIFLTVICIILFSVIFYLLFFYNSKYDNKIELKLINQKEMIFEFKVNDEVKFQNNEIINVFVNNQNQKAKIIWIKTNDFVTYSLKLHFFEKINFYNENQFKIIDKNLSQNYFWFFFNK